MMALMSACAALFIVLGAHWIVVHHGWAGLLDLQGFYRPEDFGVKPLLLGAAIASLSYIGFDAISTLAEDTIRPEHDISIATVLVCIIQTRAVRADGVCRGAGVAGFPLLPRPRNGDSRYQPRGGGVRG